jgi:hypothetical protein
MSLRSHIPSSAYAAEKERRARRESSNFFMRKYESLKVTAVYKQLQTISFEDLE